MHRSVFTSAARNASRRAAAMPAMARRGYADAAPSSDRLKLSFVLPHQTLFSSTEVTQVNLSATSGDMGILANHVPTVEQLKPGLVEVIDGSGTSKKWFVSGGFAVVQPNNQLSINAIEAYDISEFSTEAVRSGLADAQRVASGNGSEAEKAEAAVEVEVYEALQAALK